ncbi:MAG: CAP domain-containing protein [Thermoleophilia bacterium]
MPALTRISLGALAAGAVLAVAPSPGSAAPAPAALSPAALERSLLAQSNRVRTDAGLPRLRSSAVLRRPARGHSRFLLSLGRLTHDGADGSPFWTRLVAAGFPAGRSTGENLAQTSTCSAAAARTVVNAWLRSPGHRRNLLDRRFRLVGIGVAIAPGCATATVTADYGAAG